MTKSTARHHYSQLRQSGTFHGTIKRAVELWEQRQSHRDPKPQPLAVSTRAEAIPLGSLADVVRSVARGIRPRAQNWINPVADTTSRSVRVAEIDNGRYSSRCTYTHWTYEPRYRCCGVVTPGRLVAWIGPDTVRISAPRGWKFGRDNLGLYLVRQSERRQHYRYHFTGSDLESLTRLRSAALEHERTQRKVDAEKREKRRQDAQRDRYRARALALGVWISVDDSRRAGNCASGTIRWATNHNLDYTRRYPIRIVQRLAETNGNAHQVQRAIDAAVERATDELAQGYCTLP